MVKHSIETFIKKQINIVKINSNIYILKQFFLYNNNIYNTHLNVTDVYNDVVILI